MISIKELFDKYDEDPESLTIEENLIMQAHVIGLQSDQISLLKQNQKLYEKAIEELQHAVRQLQIKDETRDRGETPSGIFVGNNF